MECIFCNIVKKEIKSFTIYEDDNIIAILDAFPECDGHTLIIPKKHYATFKDLPNELVNHINIEAEKISEFLMKKLEKKGITFLMNYGDSQFVKHFHLHLLPDYKSIVTQSVEEIYEILKEYPNE